MKGTRRPRPWPLMSREQRIDYNIRIAKVHLELARECLIVTDHNLEGPRGQLPLFEEKDRVEAHDLLIDVDILCDRIKPLVERFRIRK